MAKDPNRFPPLKPQDFQILLMLLEGERHGYAILGVIQDRSGGRITMFPAQLYRYLRRMLDDGLIEALDERPAPELEDERRRYFKITPLGLEVARAEARRLEEVVSRARRGLRVGRPA